MRTRNAKREKERSPFKSPKKATTTRESSSAESPKKTAEKNKACRPTILGGAQKRKQVIGYNQEGQLMK